MSYIRADEVLPKELIETIQQYINGKAIYIPSIGKEAWGSSTGTKEYLDKRNTQIYRKYIAGATAQELAKEYALSEKSIYRILRKIKVSEENNAL